jgi:hypothetical protein
MARVELEAAAPEFELLDWNGDTVRLYDYRHRKHMAIP